MEALNLMVKASKLMVKTDGPMPIETCRNFSEICFASDIVWNFFFIKLHGVILVSQLVHYFVSRNLES